MYGTVGDTSLFDTLLAAEIKKADEFHKAREEELMQLLSALTEAYATRVLVSEVTSIR